ncbi:MAG: hypothetical protein JWM82_1754 [Myxococcales bacterium]|nr:hypothetical protein [Myxococcales bacterium]
MKSSAVSFVLASLLAMAAPAVAQPFAGGGAAPGGGMPNLRAISGRPLPDRGMPAGTVSVRVGRKTPANAVAGAEITIVTKNAGGDARMRKATTDAGGRAIFESLAPGDEFHAEVVVDGETLKTDTFSIPAEGGVRTMLIAGLGPAPAQEEGAGGGAPAADGAPAAGGDGFSLGSATGTAKPEASLPKGTLEVRLLDESGRGVPNQPITLGAVDQTNKVTVLHAQTNGEGTARFTSLATGRTSGYAAVADWHGQHIGTEPFALPEDMGARAEVHALERTSDPAVVTIGEGARVILQLREDTQQFLEMLPLENTSKKMFDPSPGALEIPLPQGFTGAEAGESGNRKLEVRANHGMAVHGPISPKASLGDSDAKAAGNEVTFGFVLPYRGGTKDFEQFMPNGIGLFTLIHEQIPGLAISGPGVGTRESRELGGKKYWIMPGSAIPAGGTMRFTVTGLPSTDHTGRVISAILALALIAAAIAFGRRPRDEARKAGASERERLESRREALFSDLMGVERAARSGATAATPERRRELVAKLEGVYQQLATLDEPRVS